MRRAAKYHGCMAESSFALEFSGIGKGFREPGGWRRLLEGVDLAVPRGRVEVIMGPSGSGKTTLLHLAAGLDPPDAGDVRVEGVSLAALDDRARTLLRRRRIGIVFQFFNLIPTLTVSENVRLPLELGGEPVRAARERAGAWLERVGLLARAADYPDRLSGGEQQRAAVARALVHGPAVVLADEPTGSLDRGSAAHVLATLAGLARDAGAAVVLATHSDEAARIGDEVHVVRERRLFPERRLAEEHALPAAPAAAPAAASVRGSPPAA